jgi:hypothetical protein
MLALEFVGHTTFQKLHFLVRDWSFPYEADYCSFDEDLADVLAENSFKAWVRA